MVEYPPLGSVQQSFRYGSRKILMRYIKFIGEFLKYPRQVGSVAASSPFLAKAMARQINGAANVVEFGPGTGSVTTEILRNLPKDGQLTCVEVNSSFCKYLETIKDPRVKIINDDVQNCNQYIDKSDCIMSSLPLRAFDKSKREKIIALSSKSKTYVQFQYTPFLRPQLKRYFRDVAVKFVPLNFPPAFVYISKNPRNKPCLSNRHSAKKIGWSALAGKFMQVLLVFANFLGIGK